MCKIHNPRKIDKCMITFIDNLQYAFNNRVKILACCCGHNRYPMTIIVKYKFEVLPGTNIFDLVSGLYIPRKRKFYKKDKEGYYYIPEVIK